MIHCVVLLQPKESKAKKCPPEQRVTSWRKSYERNTFLKRCIENGVCHWWAKLICENHFWLAVTAVARPYILLIFKKMPLKQKESSCKKGYNKTEIQNKKQKVISVDKKPWISYAVFELINPYFHFHLQKWIFKKWSENDHNIMLSSRYTQKKITMDYNVDEIVPNFYYCLLYIYANQPLYDLIL